METVAVNYWFEAQPSASASRSPSSVPHHMRFFAARCALLALVTRAKRERRRALRAAAARAAAAAAAAPHAPPPPAAALKFMAGHFEACRRHAGGATHTGLDGGGRRPAAPAADVILGAVPADALALAMLSQQGMMRMLRDLGMAPNTQADMRRWLLGGMSPEASEMLTCALEGANDDEEDGGGSSSSSGEGVLAREADAGGCGGVGEDRRSDGQSGDGAEEGRLVTKHAPPPRRRRRPLQSATVGALTLEAPEAPRKRRCSGAQRSDTAAAVVTSDTHDDVSMAEFFVKVYGLVPEGSCSQRCWRESSALRRRVLRQTCCRTLYECNTTTPVAWLTLLHLLPPPPNVRQAHRCWGRHALAEAAATEVARRAAARCVGGGRNACGTLRVKLLVRGPPPARA